MVGTRRRRIPRERAQQFSDEVLRIYRHMRSLRCNGPDYEPQVDRANCPECQIFRPQLAASSLARIAAVALALRPPSRNGRRRALGAARRARGGSGRELINCPAISAFGQTGHWSRHRRKTECDPKRTLPGLKIGSGHAPFRPVAWLM